MMMMILVAAMMTCWHYCETVHPNLLSCQRLCVDDEARQTCCTSSTLLSLSIPVDVGFDRFALAFGAAIGSLVKWSRDAWCAAVQHMTSRWHR